jgi:hypothetical protein
VSGWAGGEGRSGVERVYRRFADEEAEDLAERVPGQVHPVPVAAEDAVLLLDEGLAPSGFFLHQPDEVAAEEMHHLVQLVPEAAVAEGWDDGEIRADVGDGAADGAAAHLAVQLLHGGHEEFGIVPGGGAGCALARDGRRRGGLLGFGGRAWRWFWRAGAALDEVDVSAGGGAGDEHALQGRGAQDASVEVGEDRRDVGGAEAGGDGVEVGGGGALADGIDQVAAVVEQDADGLEGDRDVVGQSRGGVILRGIGRGGWTGCVGYVGFHCQI